MSEYHIVSYVLGLALLVGGALSIYFYGYNIEDALIIVFSLIGLLGNTISWLSSK